MIGKAVFKMHLQKIAVILAFNETLVDRALSLLTHVPYMGNWLQGLIKTWLNSQKRKLHSKQQTLSNVCFIYTLIFLNKKSHC